ETLGDDWLDPVDRAPCAVRRIESELEEMRGIPYLPFLVPRLGHSSIARSLEEDSWIFLRHLPPSLDFILGRHNGDNCSPIFLYAQEQL
ncbi:unnamed protein product, partial [Musa acuminata var. zebrina]